MRVSAASRQISRSLDVGNCDYPTAAEPGRTGVRVPYSRRARGGIQFMSTASLRMAGRSLSETVRCCKPGEAARVYGDDGPHAAEGLSLLQRCSVGRCAQT